MSSSQQCTLQICQCHAEANRNKAANVVQKRQNHNVLIFERNDYRHHNAKRRFPPKKKQFMNKEVSTNHRFTQKYHVQGDCHAEEKAIKINPQMKFYENNQLKVSCDKTLGVEAPYHAVGPSQRQKLNSPSPEVSQNFVGLANKKAPLTDRDRRVYSKTGQVQIPLEPSQFNRKLDEKFLKNFGNPEQLAFNLKTKKEKAQK